MDFDLEELRDNVDISVLYSYVTKSEFLIIKFPLGSNFDLDQFLTKLGTQSQKYYATVKGRFLLHVKHELPKDVAVRLMSVHLYNEMLEREIEEEDIEDTLLREVRDNPRDDVEAMISEMERVYKNNINLLLEDINLSDSDSP